MKDKVIFFPYVNYPVSLNKFLNNTMDALRCNYDVVRMESVSVDSEKLKTVKAVVFNWLEGFLDDMMKARIAVYKDAGVKIICFFHNKTNHDNEDEHIVEKMAWAADNSDAIVLLSRNSMKYLPGSGENKKKIFYIPHPMFDVRPLPCERDKLFNNKNVTIGFLGQIRPYKRIELLIDIAKKTDVNLIIAGVPSYPEYVKKLRQDIAGHDNIILDTVHVADNDFVRYHADSDVIVLPYDTRSGLNSSSMIMAFSCGKPVIITDIAMALDLKDKDFVHIVTGETEKEVEGNLLLQVEKCASLGTDELRAQGVRAKAYVEKNNTIAIVADRFKELIG